MDHVLFQDWRKLNSRVSTWRSLCAFKKRVYYFFHVGWAHCEESTKIECKHFFEFRTEWISDHGRAQIFARDVNGLWKNKGSRSQSKLLQMIMQLRSSIQCDNYYKAEEVDNVKLIEPSQAQNLCRSEWTSNAVTTNLISFWRSAMITFADPWSWKIPNQRVYSR